MIRQRSHRGHAAAGWTLIEMMISTGAVAATGALIYTVLTAGLTLFGRGTAVNVSHQAARNAVDQVTRDVHASISIPVLVDDTLQPVGDLDWGAGICCLVPVGSQMRIYADAAAGQNVIKVNTGGYAPTAGQRLVIPTHQIEADISTVASAGVTNVYTLTLASNLTVPVKITNSSGVDYNVVALLGNMIAYVVKFPNPSSGSGELWYYPNVNNTSKYYVVARNITSATPFAMPIQ